MMDGSASTPLAPLAVTAGEPSGIALEITLRAWQLRDIERLPPFFLLDQAELVEREARELGLETPVVRVSDPEEAARRFAEALPVLAHGVAREAAVPGRPSPANAPAVVGSITKGVELVRAGKAAALVTNPIHKKVLMEGGFGYPGHTEFLGALAGPETTPVMMLVSPRLRVVPVTVHVPLAKVPQLLTAEKIVTTGAITAEALSRDFGIAEPRIAISGLNPHAGEQGSIGREEIEIIGPAIAELRERGFRVLGPIPGDTLFHIAAREAYDAALCMYHDQALIPLKTLDFDRGVNVTLGLPFVRTSPDHGTALDIAGRGLASPISLVEALKLAGLMARRRARAEAA
jgi:4-hydroxythreonine-4-phosphate dehydrogenase